MVRMKGTFYLHFPNFFARELSKTKRQKGPSSLEKLLSESFLPRDNSERRQMTLLK